MSDDGASDGALVADFVFEDVAFKGRDDDESDVFVKFDVVYFYRRSDAGVLVADVRFFDDLRVRKDIFQSRDLDLVRFLLAFRSGVFRVFGQVAEFFRRFDGFGDLITTSGLSFLQFQRKFVEFLLRQNVFCHFYAPFSQRNARRAYLFII